MRKNPSLIILLFAFCIAIVACKTKPSTTPSPSAPSTAEVLQKLYNEYQAGQIERCNYENNTVYKCSRNAPDGGTEVFDATGTKIGGCYYNTCAVDPVCEAATDCKVIYRIAKNIWGKPGVELQELK